MKHNLLALCLIAVLAFLPGRLHTQGMDIPWCIEYGTDNAVYVIGSTAGTDGAMNLVVYAIDADGSRYTPKLFTGQGSIIPAGTILDGEEVIAAGTERQSDGSNILAVKWNYPLVSVEQLSSAADGFELKQSYPNPVGLHNEAVIEFTVPGTRDIRLTVVSMTGEEVAVLEKGTFDAGTYSTSFMPGLLPSGTYFYVLSTSDQFVVRKLVVTR
jgi:hypothetical protein